MQHQPSRATVNPTADVLTPPAVLSLLQELIRTPSINPSLAPQSGQGEAAIAAVCRDWLLARSVEAWLEEAAPGRPNVVARVGRGTAPTLVLCAHLDTVDTAGMTIAPFEPAVEGNRVYGRGSYDMKGGVAAVMCAAAALARQSVEGTVLVALVADEEYASLGAEHFVAHHRADACILTEPSEGRLILGHKGFTWVEVVTEGRAAHGSRWDLGVSAIGKMGRIVSALEQFDHQTLRRRTHPLLGPASQHCSMITGGSGLSTYSERCTLQVERRTLPGETAEQVLAEVSGVVADAGETASARLVLNRPPLICSPEANIARCVRDAATSVTGAAPAEAGVAYWMDAALFAAAGMETVNYGPGGAGAHEPVEWVDLDSVVTCASVLTDAARRFCHRFSQ
jgi:acetylornithine deacetylase